MTTKLGISISVLSFLGGIVLLDGCGKKESSEEQPAASAPSAAAPAAAPIDPALEQVISYLGAGSVGTKSVHRQEDLLVTY